MHQELGELIIF